MQVRELLGSKKYCYSFCRGICARCAGAGGGVVILRPIGKKGIYPKPSTMQTYCLERIWKNPRMDKAYLKKH